MESEGEIFSKLFESCSQYKMGSYGGKHIWENHTGVYMSEERFLGILARLGHTQKKGPVRLFKFKERKAPARRQLGAS